MIAAPFALPPSLLASTPLDQEVAASDKPKPLQIKLTPAVPKDRVALGWSPKGSQIALDDEMHGELKLALPFSVGVSMTLPHDEVQTGELWLDLNGDRARQPAELQHVAPSETRGKFWFSYSATLNLPLPGEDGATRPYPISLWYVLDPAAEDAAPVLRWSRRGWHEGAFQWDGQQCHVLITESNQDGVFDTLDAWFLMEPPVEPPANEPASDGERGKESDADLDPGEQTQTPWQREAGSRSLARHAWLGEQAFQVLDLDPHGRWITIEPFDPGVSRTDEERMEDSLREDREAPRAKAPLEFMRDFEAAEALAKKTNRPLFIDFETTWCGPCKLMDQYVYTAADVVNAATTVRVVAVKVDGDERPDLKKRFGVNAFPTLITIDWLGQEQDRRVGYQSVVETTALLQALAPL